MRETPATVYLVDDEPSVLRAVGRLLRSAGLEVRAFDSPSEFLDLYNPEAPGCVVLDVSMPQLNGLDLQRLLSERGSMLPIVFLTGRGDIPASVRAMKQGAADFLTKPVDGGQLIAAVTAGIARSREALRERDDRAELERRLATLTPREREVLDQVITGRINKEIAAELGTVEKTIKVHRARVMEKMKAGSVAELVRLAERVGVRPAE